MNLQYHCSASVDQDTHLCGKGMSGTKVLQGRDSCVSYTVCMSGKGMQGEWSRLKYQQNPMRNGASTIKEMTAVLPREASALYFRDEIGNVSTSVVRRLRDKSEVRLQPRFPLLGGWQVKTCRCSLGQCLASSCCHGQIYCNHVAEHL